MLREEDPILFPASVKGEVSVIWIRLALLILSTVGWWKILERHSSFHFSYLPVLTVSLQFCMLLMAGLLQVLPQTVWLLCGTGLAGLLYDLICGKGRDWKAWLRVETLFLMAGSLILFLVLQGKRVSHYDNFSHWATVARALLRSDQLPNAATPFITYRDYPMGSTLLVYAAARVVDSSESFQLTVQGYLMLTCILPLFQNCGGRKWVALGLILLASNFFLAYNIPISDLLVDTLLPLTGMCTLCFVCAYRNNGAAAALFAAAMMIWVLQIKNSGIFFVLVAGITYLQGARKNHQTGIRLGTMASVFLSFLLWKWHVHSAFPSDVATRHSLTFGWWEAALRSKSAEDIKHILLVWFHHPFLWHCLGFFLLVLAVAGLIVFLLARDQWKSFLHPLGFILLLYLGYQVGLVLMYIFSMPLREAFYLTEVARYDRTILIALVYLVFALMLPLLTEKARPLPLVGGLSVAMGLSVLLMQWQTGYSMNAFHPKPHMMWVYDCGETRSWMESLKEKYEIPENDRYTILIEDWDSDFFYYLGMYVFSSTNVDVLEKATLEDLEKIRNSWVLIHDMENPAVREWLKETAPEQADSPVIHVRRI